MTNDVLVFDEPDLEFRYNQRVKDPRDGLSLFGPYDADLGPRSLTHIVLGTKAGVEGFRAWSERLNCPASEEKKPRLWAPFPGFEAAFCCKWPDAPAWSWSIDCDQLIQSSRKKDGHERAFAVVEMFLDGLRKAKKLDNVNVAVCVVPDEVYTNCRPRSRVARPSDSGISRQRREHRKRGQRELFEDFDPEQYSLSPDFRRQLKARAMEFDIPIQIIRESTLRLSNETTFGERGLTPLSDRLWNLGTALYYKCGGKPWRLSTAREGVCYVGLAFRRVPDGTNTACCAAQMFLNTGDGIVFLGEFGPWYSPETRQFHLPKDAARDLLEGVLNTYQELEGKPLTEVFLHSRSTIEPEEFAGYQEACPKGVKVVGVRVRTDRFGPRLFRAEKMPVLRGTFLKIDAESGYLFGSGFKPRLATYDGWEVPVPLRIDVQHGNAAIEQVAQDILGLTKLNYNACRLGDAQPVTVGFSNAVGEILISNPTVKSRRPNFKFYI